MEKIPTLIKHTLRYKKSLIASSYVALGIMTVPTKVTLAEVFLNSLLNSLKKGTPKSRRSSRNTVSKKNDDQNKLFIQEIKRQVVSEV